MEFRILGPLEVLDEGRPIALGAAKQRALLGVLLLHANEVVSTERLVGELWGERPPASAHKLVQGYVSELRKVLGRDVVITRAPGYVIGVAESALDSIRFDRRAAAASALPPVARAVVVQRVSAGHRRAGDEEVCRHGHKRGTRSSVRGIPPRMLEQCLLQDAVFVRAQLGGVPRADVTAVRL